MNEQSTYLVQAIRGPLLLITIGVLFAFDRFTEFRFSQTWPVLLIVVGVLRLAGGPRRRRRDRRPPRIPQTPPLNSPPPPETSQFDSSRRYAESPYTQNQTAARGPEVRP